MSNLPHDIASAPIGVGFFDKNVFRKKAKLILVLKTGMAGLHIHSYQYKDGSDAFYEIIDQLKPGTELRLYREPDNPYDKWAIRVYTQDDIDLGFISRYKNETIARLMDEGRKFVACVDEQPEETQEVTPQRNLRAPTEDYRLPVAIYMED